VSLIAVRNNQKAKNLSLFFSTTLPKNCSPVSTTLPITFLHVNDTSDKTVPPYQLAYPKNEKIAKIQSLGVKCT
jgi:hypothetical protein